MKTIAINAMKRQSETLSDQVIEQHRRRTHAYLRETAARSITFDAEADTFTLKMKSGMILTIPRKNISEFDDAPAAALTDVIVGLGGIGIESAKLDVHIFLPGLLRDLLGLNEGQRAGGRAKSPAKAKAARQNGRLGGRPPAAKKRPAKTR